MTSDRRDLPCDELGPDDGADPRKFLRKSEPRVRNRKALQLCRQAAEAIHYALGVDCRDPVLAQLQVVSVEPAPDTSRLLVTLTPAPSAEPRGPAEWPGRLGRASGLLRSAVAAGIHRKRTPELAFRVV
jgi:ribosome-binding factor A